MKLFVHRNEDGIAIPPHVQGPEVGEVFPYFTRAGVPVGYDESFGVEDEGLEAPVPGMVVVHFRTNGLYTIDVEGDAIPIGMSIPAEYKNGMRLGAKLEATA